MTVDDEALRFFNKLSGILNVELSEPPQRIAEHLENLKATPSATIESLKLEVEVFENDDVRPLTAEELSRVVLRVPATRLRGEGRRSSRWSHPTARTSP